MSTSFQSCPQCESFILADTFECPECGYVFDQIRADANRAAREAEEMKSLEMYDVCRECGESVRTGLVRCWNCNAFMRSDVEAKYKEMTSQPQPIIFSDIPKDQRTEFIPVREDGSTGYVPPAQVYDADEEDTAFSLRDDNDPGQAGSDFELDAPKTPKPGQIKMPALKEKPAQPGPAKDAQQESAESPARPDTKKTRPGGPPKSSDEFDDDDLVGIAMQDQRETRRRKREKLQEARKRRILMPCQCGAWIRVHQDQAGKIVRCRQCKSPIVVPVMKKKEKGSAKGRKPAASVQVTWLGDIHLHIIQPTDVVLKPGSLEKTFGLVDAAFRENELHLIKFAPPAKKSLFSRAADGPPPVDEQKKKAREHFSKPGKINSVPFGELYTVAADQIAGVRLVQPVAEAHASMFAGVPVFGEGQIAIYLPLELADNQQGFLSFPLSLCRRLSAQFRTVFDYEIGAEQNGVPATEEFDTLKCHFSELPIKSLKNVVYYQNDPAFEVELSGHICATCGIAMTEESRARKKLGGAAGKGIAKAKCPKCSNKFGDQKAWHLTATPEDEQAEEDEDVSEVLKPKPESEAAAPGNSQLTLESLQGRWQMVSLCENGDFDNPSDVRPANIRFALEGASYTVTAADEVQEQGSVSVDLKQDPPHFDLRITQGPDAGKAHLGIIRMVDGRLENCQAAFDQARPQNFRSNAGTAATLAVFERLEDSAKS